MISIVTEDNPEDLHHTISGLERALQKTSLKKFWSIEKLYDEVAMGNVFVFYQQESGFSGVVTTGSAPLGDILFFFWGGKDPDNKVPIDYPEIDKFLVHAAKVKGCRFIQCEGRRGWKPIIANLGYSEDSTNYVKEVT